MSGSQSPAPDPSMIGGVEQPPFVRLPDPSKIFAERAERFAMIARVHELGPYLTFLARISEAQQEAAAAAKPALPSAETIAQARAHEMPPLDRNGFEPDAAFDALFDDFLARAEKIEKPAVAAEALARVRNAGKKERGEMVRSILADSIPVERIADHLYVAAALQVHFAALASQLDGKRLVAVGDGACPACGAPPVSTLIVGWNGAHGARYCSCSLCGTLWNYVRIKCTVCASTEGIGYQEVEGGAGIVKAETCEKCRSYIKVLQQHKDPSLEPTADDVASLGLDFLVRELGYRRGGVNPFLLGY